MELELRTVLPDTNNKKLALRAAARRRRTHEYDDMPDPEYANHTWKQNVVGKLCYSWIFRRIGELITSVWEMIAVYLKFRLGEIERPIHSKYTKTRVLKS